jgi:hypothetical protein
MIAGRAEFYDSALLFLFLTTFINSTINRKKRLEKNETTQTLQPGIATLKRSRRKGIEKISNKSRRAADINKTATRFLKKEEKNGSEKESNEEIKKRFPNTNVANAAPREAGSLCPTFIQYI